ncbi:hypothetical protein LTR24_000935 [Lithohypha guttulata]|uniref:MYND-type domain-containing protein n=1 Tax=Lithohypha guttulata TaxID=1690604 RepID=A0ABR0KPA0_9EURO|nr:hypothetical protein LTR24_000935 [Lithohypha guttulata]
MAPIIESFEISCATCHKTQSEHPIPMKQCAKCKTQYYCSRDCQKADWKSHKRVCRVAATAAQYWFAPCQKEARALAMLRKQPEAWFRGASIDDRDRALLFASPIPFIDYSKGSYLRKMVSIADSAKMPELIMFSQYHKKNCQAFESTEWVVETDEICKQILNSAGVPLIGYDSIQPAPVEWQSMTVNVNIQGTPGSDFDWGYLSTRATNTRLFQGPIATCELHPWDAMILRDCTPNTDTLYGIEYIASRKWDILVMKICEDYDHPWVVVAVKDAGANRPDPHPSCYRV